MTQFQGATTPGGQEGHPQYALLLAFPTMTSFLHITCLGKGAYTGNMFHKIHALRMTTGGGMKKCHHAAAKNDDTKQPQKPPNQPSPRQWLQFPALSPALIPHG